jgi:formylglycine-generating enzyme required for sulfatase activity
VLCPNENKLAEFLAGRLGADELAAVTRHLDECSLCAHLLPALASSYGGVAAARNEADVEWPERVDEYRLLEPLGRGAMGQVYLAHDERLDRTVAIKFLLGSDVAAHERFATEARAIARLSHPNVVAIHRVGEHVGQPYLVSEFVRGTGLDRLPRPLPWERALRLGTDLARGLAAAHRRGVLHRDIKPANAILADDGTVKLLDFGLAKVEAAALGAKGPGADEGASCSITQTGALLGTPLYLAPELWRGVPATAAADVYALGALIYELCAGRPPHSAESLRELRAAVASPAPELRTLVPGLSPALSALVARCLRADPAARFPSGESLLLALEELRPARQRLAAAAAEWGRLGRPEELLWRRSQLAEVAEFVDDEATALRLGDLGAGEAAFLRASRAALRRRRLGVRAALGALLCAPALVYGAARLQARREIRAQVAARVEAAEASLASARGLDRRQFAALHDAHEAFAARRRAQGEERWREALTLLPAAERASLEGRLKLDAALQLDPEHRGARALYRDALVDAAALFERNGRAAERDELLTRLAVLDPSARARLRDDASLRLEVEPASARASLSRYVSEGRRLRLAAVEAPPALTGGGARLPPGSYLLELAAEGRAPLRYPVLLARGEDLALRLALPPADAVPPGFVYVAAGRFLFGDPSEEGRLTFFDTTPVHATTTGDYVIARFETTFGEYLEFLRSLPPTERARLLPASGAIGSREIMAVEQTPAGFRYRFQRGDLLLEALEGQRVTYPARTRNREQDWLRFPVGGVPFAAARAYAAWLDRTGRVPGARLCDDHEWERAARGADGRLYPMGDRLEADDANFDRTYDQRPDTFGPDEVGSHPRSSSPFLVEDLVGNAAEWVRSSFSPTELVGRGGSFYHDYRTAQSTTRFTPEETYHDAIIGFRVCASR